MPTNGKKSERQSIIGSVSFSLTPHAEMTHSYLHSQKIMNDLVFLISRYKDESGAEEAKAIFARSAIILMAFYYECLSNSLFDEKSNLWKALPKEYHGLSKSVKKFISKYEYAIGEKIGIDYSGVQDLFTVRNKIFAHAPERAVLSSSDSMKVTRWKFKKFTDFSSSYADYGPVESDIFFNELVVFIGDYIDLLKDDLPEWWVSMGAKIKDVRNDLIRK